MQPLLLAFWHSPSSLTKAFFPIPFRFSANNPRSFNSSMQIIAKRQIGLAEIEKLQRVLIMGSATFRDEALGSRLERLSLRLTGGLKELYKGRDISLMSAEGVRVSPGSQILDFHRGRR